MCTPWRMQITENTRHGVPLAGHGHTKNDVTRQMPGSTVRVTTQGSGLTTTKMREIC